jgi:glycerol-3-phosphate dehydrogenase
MPAPVFDLAIIGGGVNGCGVARDAAGLGLSVYLCEQKARRPMHVYGPRASELLGEASQSQALGRDFGAGLSEREVDYLMRVESAECAGGVVPRRSKLGLRLGADAIAALDRSIAGRLAEGGRRKSAQRTPA